jgi:hypothetical protein
MEIINNNHDEVIKNRTTWKEATIYFGPYTTTFSGVLVDQADMKKGMFVHFLADIDRLYFYVNEDTVGSKLGKNDKGKGKGLYCNNKTIVDVLLKKISHLKRQRHYLVRKSNLHAQEKQLWEVELHKKVK